MMKNIFLRRILLVGLGLTVFSQSCTDLEEELYSDITADNFFSTEEEYISALGAAYQALGGVGNHGNLWSSNELSSDEMVVTTKGADWFDGGILLRLNSHEFQPQNDFFNNTWGQIYGGINTANRLLVTFEALGTPESEAFVAELRALRALWYFWALDAFGNVPLVTDFTDIEPPANVDRADVYEFVLSELNAVIPVLSTASDLSTYGRMTRWAALTIRCKLYLNAQVYTGTPQWELAAADAQEIIDDGPFSLMEDYSSNFAVDNQSSSENILVYPYDRTFAGGFNWPMMTLHYASQTVYNLAEQPWNGYSAIEEFYNSYVDPAQNPGPQGEVWTGLAQAPTIGTVDSRLTNFVVGPQFNPDGSRTVDPGVEDGDPDGPPLTFTPQHNEIYPFGWRQGGARIGKYEYVQGGTANLSNDFVIFRLADIILSLAEAKHRLAPGDAEALALVNQIRVRAGVDPFTELTDENLLAERGREMFAEMTRRQDLIRFGKFGDAWWPTTGEYSKLVHSNAFDDDRNIFPIPQVQIDANSRLTQNPGY